ncbi:energy transducer TonB, partial [Neisseria sicca]|uniref:energy transducer TonB family protein n=1 Tax=Neisseria sicca TaxID=490 RepID=UPI00360B12B4
MKNRIKVFGRPFSVSSDGSLSGERVTNSSGDESLDNAALEAVRSARPVGPKPA